MKMHVVTPRVSTSLAGRGITVSSHPKPRYARGASEDEHPLCAWLIRPEAMVDAQLLSKARFDETDVGVPVEKRVAEAPGDTA